MKEDKDMFKDQETVTEAIDATENEDELSYVVKFAKPYKFEGKEYTEVDLSGLEDISARDLIKVSKYLDRSSGGSTSVMPEITIEHALNVAALATQLPIEFFMGLPGKYSIRIKTRVVGFFFGAE